MSQSSSKSRELRRFEAAAQTIAQVSGDPPVDLMAPFGPRIAKLSMPEVYLDAINRYADTRVSESQGSEFTLPEDFVFAGEQDSIGRRTALWIAGYLQAMDQPAVEEIRFEVFWIVSQYAGTPSPMHFHSGDVSGVLYLKTPEIEVAEEEKTYISGRHAGYINFMTGGRQDLAKTLISFKPQVGDFYLFPGWLLHGAEPFRGHGERRSMAFNAYVTYREPA